MPFLREDEAPTQAEREKMPEHTFGDPENKKYPLDTPDHVRAAASYAAKEHNAGRLSDAKFKEISARINKAREKFGIGEENKDTADAGGAARMERVYRLDLKSGRASNVRATPQGGLLADASLTRTGVFEYRTQGGDVRRELRPASEVFAKESLDSYKGAPVTIGHPGRVGPGNWKDHTVGHLDEVERDGDFVRGNMRIQHDDAIGKAESKELREISMGYTCDLDPTPGTYQGQKFDAVQRNIRINHAALLPSGEGRMGPEACLHLDSRAAVSEWSDAGSYVRGTMDELQQAKADLTKANDELSRLKNDSKETSKKVEELGEKVRSLSAENDALKLAADKQRTDAADAATRAKVDAEFEKAVDEMVALRADARMVFASADDPDGAKWDHKGKRPDDIRREIIKFLEPKQPLVYDGKDLDGRGLKAVYDLTIQRKRDVDKERADAMAAAGGKRKGEGGDDDPDKDETEDAGKARQNMIDRMKTGSKKDAGRKPGKR